MGVIIHLLSTIDILVLPLAATPPRSKTLIKGLMMGFITLKNWGGKGLVPLEFHDVITIELGGLPLEFHAI